MFDQKDSPFYPVVVVDEETAEALDAMESGAETREEALQVAKEEGWCPTGQTRHADGFWYIAVPSPSGLITRIMQGQAVPSRKLSFLLHLLDTYDITPTPTGIRVLGVEMDTQQADAFTRHLLQQTRGQGDAAEMEIAEDVRTRLTPPPPSHPVAMVTDDYFSVVSYT